MKNALKKKTLMLLIGFMCIAAVTALGLIYFGNRSGEIIQIERNQINSIAVRSDSAIIYFAKEECETCELNYPVLETLAKNYRKNIYYYNATRDLAKDHEGTLELLHGYGFTQAPSVLIMENGDVVGIIEGDVLKDLREYFNTGSLASCIKKSLRPHKRFQHTIT